MKISYGKANIIVLLISFLLGGTVLLGVNRFYILPLREEQKIAETQLQNAENQRLALRQQKAQLEALEGISADIEDLPTLIPFGDLQPESLLATLAEAADTAAVVLTDHRFGLATPVYSSNETEESEAPSLMRINLNLTLEGDNEAQFQEFIRLLEETPRLIQVENFSLTQSLTNLAAFIEPATNQEREIEQVSDETDSVLYFKGGTIEEETADDETEYVNENGDSEEKEEVEETEAEANVERPSTPSPQTRAMRADVTIVIYFFQ